MVKVAYVLFVISFLSFIFPQNVYSQQNRDLLNEVKEERFALVIGNSSYSRTPLTNPVNDAKDISNVLKGLNFQVELAIDLDSKNMDKVIDNFIRNLKPESVALFYYAGHGIQVDGENYLIPTNFVLKDKASLKHSAYPASLIIERMEEKSTKVNIVILDACRTNPFNRSIRGLQAMSSERGTFIAFATAPNKTADDNSSENNGLFTKHLLATINVPGLNLDQVFNKVRKEVATASDKRQIPWSASSIIGDFYFIPVSNNSSIPPVAPVNLSSDITYQRGSKGERAAINERVTPLEGRVQELEEYVRRIYGDLTSLDQSTNQKFYAVDAKADRSQQSADAANQNALVAKIAADVAANRAEEINTNVENLRSSLDRYTLLTTVSVRFKTNQSELDDEDKAELDRIAIEAKNHQGYILEIHGFTDSVESIHSNELSNLRAEAVKFYLVRQHVIPIFKISFSGVGKIESEDRNKATLAENRRADVRLLTNNAVMPGGLKP